MSASTCPFCDPRNYVWQNGLIAVVRARDPIAPGHSLIVPVSHVPTLRELVPSILVAMLDAVPIVLDGEAWDGFNLLLNSGPAAGQTVMHVHLHVVPRHDGDGLRLTWL